MIIKQKIRKKLYFFQYNFLYTQKIFIPRILPESVLWLINKNKIDEAKKTLLKIARFNRKTLTDEDLAILQKSNVNGTEKYSFYHLVKTPAMRKRTLLMCYLWYVITFNWIVEQRSLG